ncbi:hypothetical protein Mpe_A2361 [Methylibium petroleiphilum PM1]|uniref:Uncharacterized protein n=1 Tax=Methylibium petroleiphilum (strain ATCC BAA-1232 / LMG 22953 / PM1) TaxID=420662 RepID=A2SIC7_METPP|nr:hypothetical protein Mpe_A2361 [Methylibium petroleiphilum PM1]
MAGSVAPGRCAGERQSALAAVRIGVASVTMRGNAWGDSLIFESLHDRPRLSDLSFSRLASSGLMASHWSGATRVGSQGDGVVASRFILPRSSPQT